MEVKLAYGKTGVTLDVPEWVEMDCYGQSDVSGQATYGDCCAGLSTSKLEAVSLARSRSRPGGGGEGSPAIDAGR